MGSYRNREILIEALRHRHSSTPVIAAAPEH